MARPRYATHNVWTDVVEAVKERALPHEQTQNTVRRLVDELWLAEITVKALRLELAELRKKFE